MRRSFSSAGVVEARPETVDRPVPSAASFLRRDGNAVFKYFQTRAETPPDRVQGATPLHQSGSKSLPRPSGDGVCHKPARRANRVAERGRHSPADGISPGTSAPSTLYVNLYLEGVRLQMVWDNLSRLGTEALARLVRV
jgi:hypothetical protein